MTSHADIDNLIAALHPHILVSRATSDGLSPPGDLGPRKDTTSIRKLAQSFATLFSYHPECDVAAVTIQIGPQSNATSLSISTSPSIPDGFEGNVQELLARFIALRKEYALGGAREGNVFSPAQKSLILHTYQVCYPAMRRSVLNEGFGDWDVFVTYRAVIDENDPQLKNSEHYDNLQRFSELVERFSERILTASDSLGEDEDVLEFHRLCMSLRDMMSNRGFSTFLDAQIYSMGTQPALTYFRPPLALSTLLTISQNPKLPVGYQWTSTFLCPSEGTRRFSAVMKKSDLAERFGTEVSLPCFQWELVEQAFEIFVSKTNRYSAKTGYEWDPNKNLLSTIRPVAVHPEVALIQHLLANGVGKTEVYIACSRPPCYASVIYAGMVNQVLKTRFTVDIDYPWWCQLYDAGPWILPEDAQPDVVRKMREHLLEDLVLRTNAWVGQRWMDGYISSGSGPDLQWEEF